MGGKHGKYVYVRRNDGVYVKVRVLKSRSDEDPEKYIPLPFKTKNPPPTFKVLKEEELPDETREKLYTI